MMTLSNSIFCEAIENFWEDQAEGIAELISGKKISKSDKTKKSDKIDWPKNYPSKAQIVFERRWLDKKDHGIPESSK